MLQLGVGKVVDIPMEHKRIEVSPYDTIITNQTAPRVLETHLPTFWFSPKFR